MISYRFHNSWAFFFFLVIFLASTATIRLVSSQGVGYDDTIVINDDYCDTLDGLDEDQTSACSNIEHVYFTCIHDSNPMLKKKIPTSRVADGVCDCCDGSDEIGSLFPSHCKYSCPFSAPMHITVGTPKLAQDIQEREPIVDKRIFNNQKVQPFEPATSLEVGRMRLRRKMFRNNLTVDTLVDMDWTDPIAVAKRKQQQNSLVSHKFDDPVDGYTPGAGIIAREGYTDDADDDNNSLMSYLVIKNGFSLELSVLLVLIVLFVVWCYRVVHCSPRGLYIILRNSSLFGSKTDKYTV